MTAPKPVKLVDKLRAAATRKGQRDGPDDMVLVNLGDLRAAIARIEAGDVWALFGEAVFDAFWSDGDPGDMEGGELQEIARDCGLLGRTAEVDAGATHAEGCDWQPGMPLDDCDCWAPMRAPWRALVREQDGE